MKILAILFILSVCPVFSQTYYMNIHQKGGTTSSFAVQKNLKITLKGDMFVISAVKGLSTAIKTFELLQNYPNPFNPTTTIEYQLPKTGNVEIKVFSINGQLVKTIESTHQTIGSHTVTWDGRNNNGQTIASGLYIYQVVFENSVLSKKMMFIK